MNCNMILTNIYLSDVFKHYPKALFERYPECDRQAKFLFSYKSFITYFLRLVGRKSGTYGVYNTISHKLYIGKATDLWRRLKIGHIDFRETSNQHLQHSIKVYGHSAFLFIIFDIKDYPIINKRAELTRLENNLIFNLGKIVSLYNFDVDVDRSGEDPTVFRKSPSQFNIDASIAANTGKVKSESHIANIKKSMISAGATRPVSLTNIHTNEVFKFNSLVDAQMFLGIKRKGTLKVVLDKRLTNVYKKTWLIQELDYPPYPNGYNNSK